MTPAAKGASGSVQSQPLHAAHRPQHEGQPRWLGIVIIGMFALGVLVVILNYAGLLPGGVDNLWLVAAIACIFVGLLLATRYH